MIFFVSTDLIMLGTQPLKITRDKCSANKHSTFILSQAHNNFIKIKLDEIHTCRHFNDKVFCPSPEPGSKPVLFKMRFRKWRSKRLRNKKIKTAKLLNFNVINVSRLSNGRFF